VRALPVTPSAFDRKNTTRTLAFALGGFTLSSGLRALPPSPLDMPAALAFRGSDSPTAARSSLLARWMRLAAGVPPDASPRLPCASPFRKTPVCPWLLASTRASEPPPPVLTMDPRWGGPQLAWTDPLPGAGA
jgi:hypothetical protein